ncbi:MAG: hypothetical protein ABJC13_03680 [Acidobacteriota bacterium]
MPFAKVFEDVYQLGVRAACVEVDVDCQRVDEQIFQETILERIVSQVRLADLIIAYVRLAGGEERNTAFLEKVRAMPMVEKQSRFIISDDKQVSRIKIWSYEALDAAKLHGIAKNTDAEIVEVEVAPD